MTADELAARTGERPGRIVRALSALERMDGDRLGVLAALPEALRTDREEATAGRYAIPVVG